MEKNFVRREKNRFKRQSALSIYSSLSAYVDYQKDYQRGQDIDRLLLDALETVPLEEMTNTSKEEWVRVLGTIANRQFNLK